MTVSGTCCDNVTNAGSIGAAQTGCSPFDPSNITSISNPSGGSGVLEYVWLSSTNGGSNYTMIAGANGSSYNPGPLTEMTWFRRCARRAGCADYVGEVLGIVYQEAASGNIDCYITISIDGGNAFSAPVLLHEETSGTQP